MRPGLNIAFFGSSLVSAYWNGAATYYRGIIRALADRGHRVTFYESDAFDRQKHRDIPDPDWAKVVVYSAQGTDAVERCLKSASKADLIVKASGNHEFLHGAFKGELLGVGDILHVELIPRVDGYGARLMRPIAIGDTTVKLRDIAARIIAVQDEQIEAMKPGALARDVDAITRQGLIASGLRPRYDNVTAYTLGLYTRTPRTSDFSRAFLPDADWPLEEGMVFHVYATAARLGFSETVVVTPEGGRRLTATARQLLTAHQSGFQRG